MQQPVMQYEPAGHGPWPCSPQGCTPAGHWVSPPPPEPLGSNPPPPPAPPATPRHSSGTEVLPRQSSHLPHPLRHAATGLHGSHFVGSSTSARLHLPLP